MKRMMLLIIVAGVLFAFTGFVSAYAQEEEEKNIDEASSHLDTKSHEPGEAKKVEARLEKEYGVTDARIDSLRQKKLGYGEIHTVFSLAKQMPGGINDQNIDKIMALRQGSGGHKEGWGKIAHELGLKLRPAAQDRDDIRRSHLEEQNEGKAEESREHHFDNHHESTEAGESVRVHAGGSADFHRGGGMGSHR